MARLIGRAMTGRDLTKHTASAETQPLLQQEDEEDEDAFLPKVSEVFDKHTAAPHSSLPEASAPLSSMEEMAVPSSRLPPAARVVTEVPRSYHQFMACMVTRPDTPLVLVIWMIFFSYVLVILQLIGLFAVVTAASGQANKENLISQWENAQSIVTSMRWWRRRTHRTRPCLPPPPLADAPRRAEPPRATRPQVGLHHERARHHHHRADGVSRGEPSHTSPSPPAKPPHSPQALHLLLAPLCTAP